MRFLRVWSLRWCCGAAGSVVCRDLREAAVSRAYSTTVSSPFSNFRAFSPFDFQRLFSPILDTDVCEKLVDIGILIWV